jgi:hypothetical protein
MTKIFCLALDEGSMNGFYRGYRANLFATFFVSANEIELRQCSSLMWLGKSKQGAFQLRITISNAIMLPLFNLFSPGAI